MRFEGKLDMRVRVLAAMTVAREFDAVYVWGAQTGQPAGRRCPSRPSPRSARSIRAACRAEDAQIVDFTRDLIRKHRVERRDREGAARRASATSNSSSSTGTIGYYSMLAMTANACELEAAEGAEVLQP